MQCRVDLNSASARGLGQRCKLPQWVRPDWSRAPKYLVFFDLKNASDESFIERLSDVFVAKLGEVRKKRGWGAGPRLRTALCWTLVLQGVAKTIS